MHNIRALAERCGLGAIEGQILAVSGGLMHKMYKVKTTSGTYAVKCLNPGIMSRPDVMKNYAEAERLEKILEDKEGENVQILCEQLYDLALIQNAPLDPEAMTKFVARTNKIMGLLV